MKFFVIPAVLAILLFSCTRSVPYRELPFDGHSVKINLAGIRENQPEFYSVVINGKRLSFFVVLLNGEVQSYFDACAKCYPRKLGFSSDGGDMRCRACNAKYHLDQLKEGIGSCYPFRLTGVEKNGMYVITKDALLEGNRFF
jgi:Membrane iron-sulfur containing protein FtrD-like